MNICGSALILLSLPLANSETCIWSFKSKTISSRESNDTSFECAKKEYFNFEKKASVIPLLFPKSALKSKKIVTAECSFLIKDPEHYFMINFQEFSDILISIKNWWNEIMRFHKNFH